MNAIYEIKLSIDHLKIARDHLRLAGANRAADYVARALKSAEGAMRHAQNKKISEEDLERQQLYEKYGDERLRG